jgi:hypothetical protein
MGDPGHGDSMVGVWDNAYSHYVGKPKVYGDPTTMEVAAAFLAAPEVRVVEDWGCGFGGFSKYVAEHQKYVGIDGSLSPFARLHVDLTEYKSSADGILVRHVLEHNRQWAKLLDNAVTSFGHRMVLVIFTPFQEETGIIKTHEGWGAGDTDVVDIGFNEVQITERFPALVRWSKQYFETRTTYGEETVFFLER